ncbi:MAG: acetyl-CoA decarbonylase/synthase complex subunit gamma [Chloroflexota bacterium]|nr:acetyl-CoA decarbonylase/synthase complex subunit gamma [Chloroflexota bacterium]
MELTGIQIYKFLPKTNCKECGFPTCLAFAMKLATKSVELSLCPHVSDESAQQLESASRPPIRLVTIGAGERKIEAGNETVMFRHEKTFFHQTGLFVRIKDTEPTDAVAKTAAAVSGYSVERVGREFRLDGIAIDNSSGDAAAFVKCVEAVKSQSNANLILMSNDPAAMEQALEKASGDRPLIYAATADNWERMAALAKKYNCPLAIYEPGGLDALAELAGKLTDAGIEDMVLDPGARDFAASLTTLTQVRRTAIKASFEPLGFPVIAFPGEGSADADEEAMLAAQQIAKYASIVVLDSFAPEAAYPLITLRLNIYTDPQKPIQMTPGIYEIGQPSADSPLGVTTNFSLTYFSIAGELEAAGFPSWLLVCDTEGLSVLTAWAAGKFDAMRIGRAVKNSEIADKVSHRKLIIPGGVAIIKGELEEELSDWTIMVGPREAVDVGPYLKQNQA